MNKKISILAILILLLTTSYNSGGGTTKGSNISKCGITDAINSGFIVIANAEEQNVELDEPTDETNPIDKYFLEIAQKIIPTTTTEMVEFELIVSEAWEAEMVNCYEILKSKTKDSDVRDLLDNDKNSYVEYILNKAEIDVYFDASDTFLNESDNAYLGTISRVLRVGTWSDGYRKKTKELFNRLYDVDVTPKFIFSEEKYSEKILQTFPEQWQKAFN